MEDKKKYIPLKDLEIYQLSRKLSAIAWTIYSRLNFHEKKSWGNQMLVAIDSVGANIAEGYSRFHYLEKVQFFFYSRASLAEGKEHWLELGHERGLVKPEGREEISVIHYPLQVKLNNTISKTYEAKKGGKNERL